MIWSGLVANEALIGVAMFDMYVMLTFLSVLENIKTLTAVQKAVTLDKSRTIMINQEVVGTVERVNKLEQACSQVHIRAGGAFSRG